ncbi:MULTISPECIES: hypothetical protein [unclassified Streptomyces]|uniref:hypothetical protein n=1 Tax=unclassified Streptomyces TaxID=2593676 RepID=UPI002255E6B1|nr:MULTISPECIES: hypothetical protein [unclassified Streptomyces]WSP55270.1 hypothetical protein OG306_13375 [Streptomyces sp. NBC_01241]WSU24000.1 hypothetical protein OG508_25740 [Streptomyces sp. NBC_01108]MCX4786945.1 hypothetical protein [Streptomyces sp. NBC_01221]WSJ38563.1 hypothetical protein OG772_22850 [Streptomyces sp. NBC_01321]WSP64851.1 hypothetical protein OG466_25460 [Streptomyces sp. NBC_01240]
MTSETKTLDTIEATTAVLQAELPRLEQHQQTLEKELATVTERLESVRTALTALRVLSAAPVPSSNTEAEDIRAEGNKVADVPSEDVEAEDVTAETEAGAKNVVAPRIPRQAQASIDTAVQAEAPQEQAAAAAPARRTARKASASKAGKQAPAKPKTTRGQTKKAVAVKDTKDTKDTKTAAKPAAKPAVATKATKAATKPVKAKAPKKAAPAAPAVDDSGNLTEMAMKVLATFGDTPVRAREVTKALGRELTPNSINTVRSTLDRLVATSRAHRAGRGLYQAPAN